jgi:hypothetical protein
MQLQWLEHRNRRTRWACGVGAAGLALVTTLLATYSTQRHGDIRTVRLEIAGLTPANALTKVIQLLQQHRGLSFSVLGGNTTMEEQRAAKRIEVDNAIEAFDVMVTSHIHDPVLADIWSSIRNNWRILANGISLRSMIGRESFAEHTVLIQDNLRLLDSVLDYFGLTLDPSADGSHLIMGTLLHLPQLTESLGQARARGALYLSTKHITVKKRLVLAKLIETANTQHAQMAREIRKAMAVNPQVNAALSGLMEDSATLMRRATHLVNTQIVDTRILHYPPTDYFTAFTEVIDGQLKLLTAAKEELNKMFQARIAELRGQRTDPSWIRLAKLLKEQMKVIGFIGVVIGCAVWLRAARTRQTARMSRLLAIASEQLSPDVQNQATPHNGAVTRGRSPQLGSAKGHRNRSVIQVSHQQSANT